MKRWPLWRVLPLWLVWLLSACSSPQKVYYQLPVVAQSSGLSVASAEGRQLWVAPVTLADSLAGNGILFQTSAVRYTIATNNLWASPLDQQLQQALVASLRNGLPGWHVATTGVASAAALRLQVNVTAFQGRFDGNAVIRGEWVLQGSKRIVTQPFSIDVPQTEDGYDALVSALGKGWQQVAEQVSQRLLTGA
ncbi:membrane integrity-associated transporter subunit PqiC [Dickeya sp. CFBP 2040]|uniref:Membrane integrity-associated transporter subunit PqiC n=1 Tax=Dickeya poaceiphila TaxID=568768 RepID=A0A5B8HIW0_9GAMM|nr:MULTISPECIES: membrane integrity-associated transporter subunit PqiC [Dickeya]NKI73824.1 membrane integrity-associated transporter subunit PqiC [Dickeya sp. CFBP 2040]QDX29765.1 membrane integrity-associated transporter subunit PqiC [Dickeya poaceiphila]